jgi:rhamnogalacturonyl hydrolase YesR
MEVGMIDDILAERGSRYGEFSTHAAITQAIKHEIRQGVAFTKMEDHMVEALDMIAHKIGRIVNGDPRWVDSWTDVAGYAKLVADILEEDQLKKGV